MKKLALLVLAASALLAAGANAATVSAFDFSQFLAPGFMSLDGATPAGQLSANYSDLDGEILPGLGFASEPFGTLFLDGTGGSSVNTFGGPFTNGGELLSNNDVANVAGVELGSLAASNSLVIGEGSQLAFSAGGLQILGTSAASAVFQADLSSINGTGDDWGVSFGGNTAFGGVANVEVQVSLDGNLFTTVGTANLTAADTPFAFALGVDGAVAPWVRLNFENVGGATVDNFAFTADVTVPEPGTIVLGLFGVVGLAVFGRRR